MEQEIANLQGIMLDRKESPCFEEYTEKLIEDSLKTLLENKNLYQSVKLDFEPLRRIFDSKNIEYDKENFEKYLNEISIRPWSLQTHHQGNDEMTVGIVSAASSGLNQPLGTPWEDTFFSFYAPRPQLSCPCCKEKRTFEALNFSRQRGLGNPYPRKRNQIREQVFVLYYRCLSCREHIYAVLISREGCRLRLCGFAPRREFDLKIKVSKKNKAIAIDAKNAALEGDIFAGFYHLRTLIEHVAKEKLGIDLMEQIPGEELLSKYNSSIPDKISQTVPSLKPIYEELSEYLHCRKGRIEDFDRIESTISDHFELIKLLEKHL